MKHASVFYFSLRVPLRADERDALMQLSMSERRDPRAQAALIIRNELERLGLLAVEMNTQTARLADAAPRSDDASEGVKCDEYIAANA
jgi:hypothetical protein